MVTAIPVVLALLAATAPLPPRAGKPLVTKVSSWTPPAPRRDPQAAPEKPKRCGDLRCPEDVPDGDGAPSAPVRPPRPRWDDEPRPERPRPDDAPRPERPDGDMPGSHQGPVQCSGNDEVVLANVMIDGRDGPGIQASGNCQLLVRGGRVTGDAAIRASGNAEVVLEGCVVVGAPQAVNASGNADVVLVRTKVAGGIRSSGNSDVVGIPLP